jgi:hypothetical protein
MNLAVIPPVTAATAPLFPSLYGDITKWEITTPIFTVLTCNSAQCIHDHSLPAPDLFFQYLVHGLVQYNVNSTCTVHDSFSSAFFDLQYLLVSVNVKIKYRFES